MTSLFGRRSARFHAAAVSVSGHGILLPGPRRSGKSILTLGLLLKGAEYLSEDVAVLEHRSLRLTTCGTGVSVRREGLTIFPEMVERWIPIASDEDGDPYQQVGFASPDQIGSRVSRPCRVSFIVFPTYDPGGPGAHLEPLPAGQAVLRLLEHCISLGAVVERGLDVVIALTEKAETYVLRYHDARQARDRIFERATAGMPRALVRPPVAEANSTNVGGDESWKSHRSQRD